MKWKTTLFICSAAALLVFAIYFANLRSPPQTITEQPETSAEPSTEQPETPERTEAPVPDETAPEPEASAEPYVSPIDFDALWEENEDIYAWLDIPGTEISYPILQHPEDDAYYLRRNAKGESDSNGVIYSEASYNGRDFTDPLTVLYGHNMNNGLMFGTLQEMYSSQEALNEHSEIIIYLPDRELHYEVFAAVPFDKRHILYNYDLSDKRTFRLFFQEILSVRSLEAVFAEDAAIQSDEKALILSTCLTGNRSKRFLVCGKLSETVPTETSKS